jgi:5'-methylthioadenosine phosphorylase
MDELKVGIIGGSGLGTLLGAEGEVRRHEIDTPFGWPSEAIVETEWAGVPVFLLGRHGVGHTLNPGAVPYRANIFALKQLGCTAVIASGAVGSLREEFKPGELVVVDQVIDKTIRPASFFEKSAVHVEFGEPFCPVLRQILIGAGSVHDRGCYVAMDGPAFSTRAESLMHRIWGGDVVGMTGMPEAKLAREAEMSYAMVALVTDYDSWKSKSGEPTALLEEIRGNLAAASGKAMDLIRAAVGKMGEQKEALSGAAAREALKLGIWSDKSKIAAAEIEKLRPIWGRYF